MITTNHSYMGEQSNIGQMLVKETQTACKGAMATFMTEMLLKTKLKTSCVCETLMVKMVQADVY